MLLLFRMNPLSEFNSVLMSSEIGKESFCMTHHKSQGQMTEISELSRDECIKGSKELAVATSFSSNVTMLAASEVLLGPSLADYNAIDPRGRTGTSERFLVLLPPSLGFRQQKSAYGIMVMRN